MRCRMSASGGKADGDQPLLANDRRKKEETPHGGERGFYKFLLGRTVMGRDFRHRADDTNLD